MNAMQVEIAKTEQHSLHPEQQDIFVFWLATICYDGESSITQWFLLQL